MKSARRVTLGIALTLSGVILAAFRCPGPEPQTLPLAAGGGGDDGEGGSDGGGNPDCQPGGPDDDQDGDGFTELQGDCDDCDEDVHPAAAELPTRPGDTPRDDDCDGDVDEVTQCEPEPIGSPVGPLVAATAIELCDTTDSEHGWGLEDASFVKAAGDNPNDAGPQAAVRDGFGKFLEPRVGSLVLVLSTGHAADVNDPGSCPHQGCFHSVNPQPLPDGHPKSLPPCAPTTQMFDDISLEVALRPPPNARAFAFYSAFLSHEYPEGVCSAFHDEFLALVTPPAPGASGPNVIHDADGFPPGVLFRPMLHCDDAFAIDWAAQCMGGGECPDPPDSYCPAGSTLLEGTAFAPYLDNEGVEVNGGATTGWLYTEVPIPDGDELIEVRFMIYDAEDADFDSTVLIDGFTWLGDAGDAPKTDFDVD